jgi:hypothetical protein
MGRYANHGVEYHIIYKSGSREIIAAMKDTDTRLLASMFYQKHKNSWFERVFLINPHDERLPLRRLQNRLIINFIEYYKRSVGFSERKTKTILKDTGGLK